MVSVYFRIENNNQTKKCLVSLQLSRAWELDPLLNYIYLWPAGEHCLYTCVDNVYTKMRVRAYVVDVQNKEIVSQNDQ